MRIIALLLTTAAIVAGGSFSRAEEAKSSANPAEIIPYPFTGTSQLPEPPQETKQETKKEEAKKEEAKPEEKKAESAKPEVLSSAPAKPEEQNNEPPKTELLTPKPLPEPVPEQGAVKADAKDALPAPVTPETLKKPGEAEETAQSKPSVTPETLPAPAPEPVKVEAAPITPEVLKKADEPKAELATEAPKTDTLKTTTENSPAAVAPTMPELPASLPVKEVISSPKQVTVIKKETSGESKTETKVEAVSKQNVVEPKPAVESTAKTEIIPQAAVEKPQPKKSRKKKAAEKKSAPRQSETVASPVPAAPSSAATSAFTPETRQVFDVIESSIAKSAPAAVTGKVSVSHDDYVTSLSEFKNPENENIGLKMQVKKSDEDITKLLNSAYNALTLGQYESSVALYKEVLRSDNDNQNALVGLAAAYQKSGDMTQAKTIYGKLLGLYPENQEGINNFLSLAAAEAPIETLAKLRQMERINPRYSVIPAQIAMINAKLGDMGEASRYLKRAVSLQPDNMGYRFNLAIILDKAGEKDQAIAVYRQLIDAHQKGIQIPGNVSDIQERLTYLGSK